MELKSQKGCKSIAKNKNGSKGILKFLLFIIVVAGCIGLVSYLKPDYWAKTKQLAQSYLPSSSLSATPQSNLPIVNKIAILSDTHEDTTYFPQIVDEISRQQNLSFVAHLGDLSNAGDLDKLKQAKATLDKISAPVYVLPGDHDLNWYPQHDLTNFKQVFNKTKTYFSLSQNNQHFIFIDNSDLNNGIDPSQWSWLENDLKTHQSQPIFVFMSTPTSNPYLSFKAMGSQNQTVAAQAKQLAQLLSQSKVKVVFAGDTHVFSQYPDTFTKLPIVTVGSAGSTKNLLPLYLIVEFFSDGSYNVASIPYEHAIPLQGSD